MMQAEALKHRGGRRIVVLNLGGAISTASVAVAGVVAVLGVVGYQNRRAKLSAIRSAFSDVIGLLAAEDIERRLAGAILLRRFLDPHSELGIRDVLFRRRAPYAKEAQAVMAAVLRGIPRGDLQKLLADGLAHAQTLENADLQRTNLQDAYLAPRGSGGSLKGADFYRADLGGASLKGVEAQGAVFYQARLQNTVLRDAQLQGASFFQADLSGADFGRACLKGASFAGARNIPGELMPYLCDGDRYCSSEPAPTPPASEPKSRHVFLSAPSTRTPAQDLMCERLAEMLSQEGLVLESLRPRDYPPSGALSEIARRLAGCAGVVVLGLRHVDSDKHHATQAGITPWTHVEAGMAFGQGLPLLILREPEVHTGAFDDVVNGHRTHVVELGDCWNEETMRTAMAPWIFEMSD